MQHLINQLPDEQLLDLFILIEDKHEQLAVEYLLKITHFTKCEAIAIVNFAIQQRNLALIRYIKEDRTQGWHILEYKKNILTDSTHYFQDEFLHDLDFSESEPLHLPHPSSENTTMPSTSQHYWQHLFGILMLSSLILVAYFALSYYVLM